jgi:hypothetical protein
MNQPRKASGQQLSCNNNFAKAIAAVLSDTEQPNQGLLFRDWIPLTLDEKECLNRVEEYFESCKTTDEERDDNQAQDQDDENKK